MYTKLSLETSGEVLPLARAAERLVTEHLLAFDAQPDALPEDLAAGKKLLRDGGYYGVRLPAEYGGAGAPVSSYLQVLAELYRAHHLLLPELILANGIGALPLLHAATEADKQRLLPQIARGEKIVSFALTEPDAGSDTGSLSTRARADGSGWVLNGEKHYIGHAGSADLVTVIARVDGDPGGFAAFLVAGGTPGFEHVENQPNLGGWELAHLRLQDCRVPGGALLGTVGDGLKIGMRVLDEGRLHVAAMCIGMADRALQIAAEYTAERVQFGQPIARFDAIRFMIAESYAELSLAVAHARETAADLEAGRPVRLQSAVAKYNASEMVVRVVDRCLSAMGAAGYLKKYPMERLYRAARVQKIYDGTSEIMRLIIEKEARASFAATEG